MGVRPPANDVDDDPDVVEFGIAALDARLEDAEVSYPVSRRQLQDQLGHVDVPFDATGHSVTFGEALGDVDREQFDSQQDLLNALHPVFEQKRQATSTSLLSQLRALVPL